MLQLNKFTITHRYDFRVLIDNLTVTINPGDKLALIGEEGNGKSTLLKAIYDMRLIEDYAEVTGQLINKTILMGYLPQTMPESLNDVSINNYLFDMSTLEQIDFNLLYQYASQLGLDSDRFDSHQLLGSLSGGEKIKLQLIKNLARDPQLILLDEPSNDLDFETLEWLTYFIKNTEKTIIFISHDETLLTQTANRLILFETQHHKKVTKTTLVNLDYDTFIQNRERQFDKDLQIATKQREEHKKQMQRQHQIHQAVEHKVRNTHDATAGRLIAKKMKNVLATQERLHKSTELFKEIPIKEEAILVKLRCHQPLSASKIVLNYQDQSFSNQQCNISQLGLVVQGQDKIGIIGANGIGKTTLLKKIYQDLIKRTDLRVGYMPQDYSQVLPYDKTPIEFLKRSDEKDEITLVTTFLGSIRFTYDEMHHTIGELSGGQKAKLLLLKMDLDQVNVLIVDEPTRNFSPLSQREVRQIFQNFEGCLIVVSHDRLFNQEVCHRHYRLTHNALERLSNQKQ